MWVEDPVITGMGGIGLFSWLEGDDSLTPVVFASVRHLTVHGRVAFKGDLQSSLFAAGGIVGMASKAIIEDCHFVGTVDLVDSNTDAALESNALVGGVVGATNKTSVKDCTASGSVSAKSELGSAVAGGIVGCFYNSNTPGVNIVAVLTGCVSDVTLSATGATASITGGVAGGHGADPGVSYQPPSGCAWYGKGADCGYSLGWNGSPGNMAFDTLPTPSNDGAKKGTGAKILSRWLPEGRTGKAYSAQVIVAGKAPLSVDQGALPEGLTISGTRIVGVPEKTGKWKFTLKAKGSKQKFSIRIRNGSSPVDIETTELPPVGEGQELMVQMEASGTTGKVTWSILEGELPEGLELSEGGVLSGAAAPGRAGTYLFTVMVVDAKNNGATQELTLTVRDGGVGPDQPEEKKSALVLSLQGDKTSYGPGEDLVLTVPAGVLPPQLDIDEETGKIVAMLNAEGTALMDLIPEGAVLTVGGRTVAYVAKIPEGIVGAIHIIVSASALDALRPGQELEVRLSGVTADRLATLVAIAGKIGLTGGGGGDDPSGKKSGGGGCDMGLGGLAMMALAGAATRRKRS